MKKISIMTLFLLIPIALIGQGYQNHVGIYSKFPFTHVGNRLDGVVECQPELLCSTHYGMIGPQSCGEERYGYVLTMKQVLTPEADTAYFYSWIDMREANTSFENTKYKIVYTQIATEPRYPNGRSKLKMIEFYIAEFYDSSSNRTVAFEYGSKWGSCGECGMDSIFCSSHFMNEGRIEYSEGQYKGKMTEKKMFEAANGAYLYELRNNNGKAVGIRYYCTNNKKEYVMYFR